MNSDLKIFMNSQNLLNSLRDNKMETHYKMGISARADVYSSCFTFFSKIVKQYLTVFKAVLATLNKKTFYSPRLMS